MNISILYFFIAFVLALLVAAFLYKYPKKKRNKVPFILFLLRFLSVVAILLLLINPKWQRNELRIEKPSLVVAVDNSASIHFIKGEETVGNSLDKIRSKKELEEKFEVSYYSFGSQTQVLDSLTFDDSQTNPSELLEQIELLNTGTTTPILLLTDGNQTMGSSYEFSQTTNPVYPIVVGDTTAYEDLAITHLNINQYAFLDNNFSVEIFALYKGSQNAGAQISIHNRKSKVFSKNVQFTAQKTSHKIRTLLPAEAVGQAYYRVEISALPGEKNTQNNRKDFSIEVVDQQTNILILSSFSHPDLGALKKSIESNKQRKVTIDIGNKIKTSFSEYQLIILYQPIQELAAAFTKIIDSSVNNIIITGTKTDWNFLNNVQQAFYKNATDLSEDYLAVFNMEFDEFLIQDIGFKDLPPLQNTFGTVSFKVPYQSLLFQKIGNVFTEKPLLASYLVENQRNAVLFGEGFWRWRMLSKIENKSYKEFDDFFAALIQYTASNKKMQQLHLDYKRICFSNQPQLIKASYVDANHQVDTKSSLWLYLTDKESNQTEKMPFYLTDAHYEINLPSLESNTYDFQVVVAESDIKKSGNFKVLDYNVEQQFITANQQKLKDLAQNTAGDIIHIDDLDSHLQSLVENESYKGIQKSKKITKPLIDWHWLLGFIILSLSAEWFIRKYKGLI